MTIDTLDFHSAIQRQNEAKEQCENLMGSVSRHVFPKQFTVGLAGT